MLTGVPEQSLLISPIPAGEEAFLYLVRQRQPRSVPRCRPMTSTFRGCVQRTVRSCRGRWPLSLGRRWATIIRTPSWPRCPTSCKGSSMLSMWRRGMRTPPIRKENAPAEYCLGPQPGRPCGRERPAFRRADTQRARCKNSDATRSTLVVGWTPWPWSSGSTTRAPVDLPLQNKEEPRLRGYAALAGSQRLRRSVKQSQKCCPQHSD